MNIRKNYISFFLIASTLFLINNYCAFTFTQKLRELKIKLWFSLYKKTIKFNNNCRLGPYEYILKSCYAASKKFSPFI